METSSVILSEHLKGFSAVSLRPSELARALEDQLKKYGVPQRSQLGVLQNAFLYITPVKSFTTRFVLLGLGGWSILITDMRGENCSVDAYSISRATGARGLGVFLQSERREISVFEGGHKVREVQSLLDGDRWYYREEGLLKPFEDRAEYLRKRKRDRLTVAAVGRYFEAYTSVKLPDWRTSRFDDIIGIERPTKELRVPLVRFETINDLLRNSGSESQHLAVGDNT